MYFKFFGQRAGEKDPSDAEGASVRRSPKKVKGSIFKMLDPEFKTTEPEEAQSDVRETAVESPESRFDDGREGAVDPYEGEEDQGSDAGEGDEDSSDSGGAVRSGDRGQTREENSAIRAARLRARREAEAEAKAGADRTIAESGIINPYTGKPFGSLDEFRDYGERVKAAALAERAAAQGKSAETLSEEEENRRFITELRRREKENAAKEAAEKQRHDFIADDVLEFVEDYPEFNDPDKLSALERSESFREFCGSRFGREPLSKLYGAYKKLVGRAGAEAAAKNAGRSERSTGSGGASGETLSPSQKKALDRWNAENPDMAMTAKEFLSR